MSVLNESLQYFFELQKQRSNKRKEEELSKS
jgi:hypothetical protein